MLHSLPYLFVKGVSIMVDNVSWSDPGTCYIRQTVPVHFIELRNACPWKILNPYSVFGSMFWGAPFFHVHINSRKLTWQQPYPIHKTDQVLKRPIYPSLLSYCLPPLLFLCLQTSTLSTSTLWPIWYGNLTNDLHAFAGFPSWCNPPPGALDWN